MIQTFLILMTNLETSISMVHVYRHGEELSPRIKLVHSSGNIIAQSHILTNEGNTIIEVSVILL